MINSLSQIRPISDLRNNFAEISKMVHESGEPVILTKNGYADLVVLGAENYHDILRRLFIKEIDLQLHESSVQAKNNPKRYTHEEVFAQIRKMIAQSEETKDV